MPTYKNKIVISKNLGNITHINPEERITHSLRADVVYDKEGIYQQINIVLVDNTKHKDIKILNTPKNRDENGGFLSSEMHGLIINALASSYIKLDKEVLQMRMLEQIKDELWNIKNKKSSIENKIPKDKLPNDSSFSGRREPSSNLYNDFTYNPSTWNVDLEASMSNINNTLNRMERTVPTAPRIYATYTAPEEVNNEPEPTEPF
jgi:hypothetical protein